MLPAISPQEAFERFSKGEARLVDIRETDEYTQEFVPGSRLIPLSIIAKHPLKDADAGQAHHLLLPFGQPYRQRFRSAGAPRRRRAGLSS